MALHSADGLALEELDFESIRPYRDDEVDGILQQLLQDKEFLSAIGHFRAPLLMRAAPPLARKLIQWKLSEKLARFHTVAQLQLVVEEYLDQCLESSAAAVTCEGLERLQHQENYLFLCNHRDIVLDPAMCNLFLHRAGRDTFRIAIGDNLLKREYSSHLMRLNKSFIVKRGIESRREKLLELKRLSAYIRHSITQDHQSIWIAHREGRAKNGLDRTETALLKMLNLSGDKDQSFSENCRELRLVPTAVSYEWDPCDLMKARELAALASVGSYEKSEFEDMDSIATSILEHKGDIHVAFGAELVGDFESAEVMAQEIDRQIHLMYRLHPSNLVAYRRLEGRFPTNFSVEPARLRATEAELDRRLSLLTGPEQDVLLNTYANSVRSRERALEYEG